MKKSKANFGKLITLREKAEKRLAAKGTDTEPMSVDDTRQLIHELQVHQIELEMQNEELRRAQNELEESRSRYSDLYDFAPIGYFTFDQQGLIHEVNLTGSTLLGVERSSLIKKPFSLFIAPEHKDAFYLHRQQVIKTRARKVCEIRLVRKDGTKFYAQLESTAVDDLERNAHHCRTVVTDITERKQLEESLRAAHDSLEIQVQERTAELIKANEFLQVQAAHLKEADAHIAHLSSFPELNPKPIIEINTQGVVTYLNQAAKKAFLGLPEEADESRWFGEVKSLFDTFEKSEIKSLIRELQIGNCLYEQRIHFVTEIDCIRMYYVDITERRQAEEALLRSNQRFELLAETANRLLVSEQPQQFVEELCRKVMAFLDCHAFFNFLADDSAGRLHLNACAGIHEEEARKIEWLDYGMGVCGSVAAEGQPIIAEDIFTTPDPRTDSVKSFGIQAYACHPLIGAGSKVLGTLAFGIRNRPTFTAEELELMKTVADQVAIALERVISKTELQAAHEIVLSEKNRLETLMETIPVGVAILDSQGGDVKSNTLFEELWGKPRPLPKSVIDYAAYQAWWPDTGKPVQPEEWASSLAVRNAAATLGQEMRIKRFDGNYRFILNSAAPILDADGTVSGCVVAIQDITERKKTEESLRKSRDELELRVQERTAELSQANARLREEVQERKRSHEIVVKQTQLLEAFFNNSIIPLVFLDKHFNYIRVNEAYARACQRTVHEFPGQNHFALYPYEETRKIFEQVVATGDPYQIVDDPFIYPDHLDWGVTYRDWNLTPLEDETGEVGSLVFSLKDVTEQKRAEQNIYRLSRLYLMLSQINQTIMFQRDRNQLLNEICRVAVEYGKFRMAWIGLVDPFTRLVNPVTHTGAEENYLESIRISINDAPEGRGPTGRAIRERRCVVCSDIQNDPQMAPWRDEALRRGYCSSAAVPIRVRDTIIGAFTVYAVEPHFFDKEETNLLKEIGMNISFALSVMEDEAQHQLADAAVQESEARFKSLIQTAPIVILNLSPDGAILEFNPEAELVYGQTREEVLGKNFFDLFIPDEKRIRMADNVQKVLGGEPVINFEMPTRRADGSLRLFIWNVDRLLDNRERPSGIIAIAFDITERKQMEKALQESEEQLRYLSASLMAAQENERKRIAREIHDELGQALTVLKLRLRSVEKRLRKNQVALREDCENLLQYTDEIVKIIRRISRELTPSILEDLGFTAAVRWLVDSFRKDQAIKIALDTADINNLLVKDAQIVVYRILQEALNNITKHAQAQHVAVLIREFENKLLFCVEDDGKGFDLEQVSERDPTERGLGLKTMHERALMVKGSLDLVSQEGKGTRITLSIPITGTGRR